MEPSVARSYSRCCRLFSSVEDQQFSMLLLSVLLCTRVQAVSVTRFHQALTWWSCSHYALQEIEGNAEGGGSMQPRVLAAQTLCTFLSWWALQRRPSLRLRRRRSSS